MHYIGKSSKNTLTSNPIYENNSQGYSQASLIDHTTGAVHTGLSLNQLAVDGTLSPHVHSYEEGFYVLTGQAINSIPVIGRRNLVSQVRLRNDEWAVIGGLLNTTRSKSTDGFLGLAGIPLLGYLFRHTTVSTSSQELLFFLTPRILPS